MNTLILNVGDKILYAVLLSEVHAATYWFTKASMKFTSTRTNRLYKDKENKIYFKTKGVRIYLSDMEVLA